MTLPGAEYAGKFQHARQEVFLADTQNLMLWNAPLTLIETVSPEDCQGRCLYPVKSCLPSHAVKRCPCAHRQIKRLSAPSSWQLLGARLISVSMN